MAFEIKTHGSYGSGSAGSLTPTAANTVINHYGQVTALTGKTFTLGNVSSGATFPVNSWVLIHVIGHASKDTWDYVGRWTAAKITAVDGDTYTVNKTIGSLAGNVSDALVQIISIPEYSDVTLNSGKSIAPLAFDHTKGYGGVVAFRCSGTLKFNGGHINLAGKGIDDYHLRPDLSTEKKACYEGFENYDAVRHLPINDPDGACWIVTAKMIYMRTAA